MALLSVGEESKKGTQDVVEAHAELAAAPEIDFRGNVEGRDLLGDAADVIVTDGFTGNVALKTIEGTAKTVASAVGAAARSNPVAAVGGLLLRPALGGLRRRMDPDTTGGAILLGLRGVAVVGHGSSGPDGDRERASGSRPGRSRSGRSSAPPSCSSAPATTRAAMRDRKEAQ